MFMDEMKTKKRLKQPKAVIFDWDNTLADTWPLITEALNVTRQAFGLEVWTREYAIKTCSSRSARNLFPEWYGQDSEKALEMFYDYVDRHHLKTLMPLEGAEELLLGLKQKNIPIFVVTNKRSDVLKREINCLGWKELFSAVAGSTDTINDKPARDPVDKVLHEAGLQADDPTIWFVGDSHADVECARNAGCTPVLIGNEDEANRLNVDLSFSGCRDLLDLLYTLDPS